MISANRLGRKPGDPGMPFHCSASRHCCPRNQQRPGFQHKPQQRPNNTPTSQQRAKAPMRRSVFAAIKPPLSRCKLTLKTATSGSGPMQDISLQMQRPTTSAWVELQRSDPAPAARPPAATASPPRQRRLTVTISAELHRSLKQRALNEDVSLSDLVTRALTQMP